jgi:phosphonate transport system substrate-binding protein
MQLKKETDEVAAFLTREVGHPVRAVVPASYGATVQALVSNQAHVAYTSALPFILARREAPVRLLLAEVRNERTDYDSIFVVRADSTIQCLEDLRGKRMLFTSPTSTSGYLMPYSRLVREGLLQPRQEPSAFFGQISFGGGYDRALLGVLNGQADVCAVSDYTMEGDRASVYLNDEQRSRLRILSRTSGVPTHSICVRKDLPAAMQERIAVALLKLAAERPELLADVYGTATLRRIEDEDAHLRGCLEALENTGLGVERFAQ